MYYVYCLQHKSKQNDSVLLIANNLKFQAMNYMENNHSMNCIKVMCHIMIASIIKHNQNDGML